jgi:predicted RNA-binding protein YlqC (UPF0109 family)
MKKLLEYLIKAIVDHPDKVKIDEKNLGEESSIKIRVHPDDMGKVIGKGGKIIKAIRRMAYILAIKKKKRLILELNES